MNKVISWCLYVDPGNMDRLPEYLMGLRYNQRAARMFFPGWKLRLYINSTIRETPELWEFVHEYATYGYPEIELCDCEVGKNPMTERYRPFFDPDVDVCIARDIDSILSKLDADMVNDWLANPNIDILRYREHGQSIGYSMGGGIGIKCRAISPEVQFVSSFLKGRGHDEHILKKIISSINSERHIAIKTRMTSVGVYCLYTDSESILGSTVLWTIPFYDALGGYASNYPNCSCVEIATIAKIVEFVRGLRMKKECIGIHHAHNHEKILCGVDPKKWIR